MRNNILAQAQEIRTSIDNVTVPLYIGQSDCQMLIPSALYNNWKSATNWATYASKMVSV